MTKPTITQFSQLSPLIIQQYERYLPSAFDNSLSILEKMNKIIQWLDEVGEITNELVTQWNQITEWILGEGLENAVNDQLQTWLDDGTISDLLNDFYLKSLTQENINPSYLFAFFRHNADTRWDLFLSEDGVTMDRAYRVDFNLRDPSLLYHDGYYYIAYTSYNPHDIGILRSKNLTEWEDTKVSFGLYNQNTTQRIWAPDWFTDDNGDIYLVISVWVGESTDIDGNTIPSFRPYVVPVTDLENFEFDSPRMLQTESTNKIDGHIVKHNGQYILFIKDEYDKYIEKWVSPDMITWSKSIDQITELGQYVEGAFVVKVRDGFQLYVDAFKEGQTYYSFSADLNYFNERKPIDIMDNHRHGTGIRIEDEKGKKIFTDFYSSFGKTKQRYNKNIENLNDFATNSIIDVFKPIEGNVYSVGNNENLTINSVLNTYNAKYFYVVVRTNSVGSLKFLPSGDIEIPSDGFEINVTYGDNDVLFKFEWVEQLGKFKSSTPTNRRIYEKQIKPIKLGWKTVTLSPQTTSSLTVEDGVVYRVNGTDIVTINGVSSLPSGSTIGFLLASNSPGGKITINNGTNITCPNGKLEITVDAVNNEKVHKFLKVDGSTFRLVT